MTNIGKGLLKARRGFTFIEVMVSLSLLSFMVSELAMLSIHASRSSTYAQRLTRANMIAEDVLEKCRNKAFDSLDTAFTESINGTDFTETCVVAGGAPNIVTTCTFTGHPGFNRTRTVQFRTTGVAATSYMAEVNISVSWADARGQTQRAGVASVISKY